MHTTLNRIRAYGPCLTSWERGLALLGKTKPDDEPIPIIAILDVMGLGDALWCLRAVEGRDRDIRLLAVTFASEVKHLMTDPRSLLGLDVSTAYAEGRATDDELAEARKGAYAAAADAASAAASAAAHASASAASADADAAAFDAMRARQAETLRELCQRAAQEGKT